MSGGRWGRKGKNVLQEVGRAYLLIWEMNLSGGSVVKKLPGKAGDTGDGGLIPGLGKPPGGGNGNPLQYSCLENPMDRGAWRPTVHKVAKSQTQLSTHAPWLGSGVKGGEYSCGSVSVSRNGGLLPGTPLRIPKSMDT